MPFYQRGLTDIGRFISSCISGFARSVIAHPRSNFKIDLPRPLFKWRHAWEIATYIFMLMRSLIHASIPMLIAVNERRPVVLWKHYMVHYAVCICAMAANAGQCGGRAQRNSPLETLRDWRQDSSAVLWIIALHLIITRSFILSHIYNRHPRILPVGLVMGYCLWYQTFIWIIQSDSAIRYLFPK